MINRRLAEVELVFLVRAVVWVPIGPAKGGTQGGGSRGVCGWSVGVHSPLRAPQGRVCRDFGGFVSAFGPKYEIGRPFLADLVRNCAVLKKNPNTPWILGLFGTVEL